MELMIPFNAINGDRVYDAEDIASMLASVISDGVHPNPGTSLQVRGSGGWDVNVLPGRCVIKGHVGVSQSPVALTAEPPEGTLPRIDAVIIRCDFDARLIEERLIKGAASSQPEVPSLQRDEHAWELMLARINIAPTASGVAQMDITDTRWNAAVCGALNSMIEVDAEELFAQFEAAWSAWFERIQQEAEGWQDGASERFEEWLSTVQDLLDGNAAAQLASAIASLDSSVSQLTAAQPCTVYEKSRETGSVDPSAWVMSASLGLWRAVMSHPGVTYTDSDVTIILQPDSLREPILAAGLPGSGSVTMYASRKPDNPVNYTIIVTGVRT